MSAVTDRELNDQIERHKRFLAKVPELSSDYKTTIVKAISIRIRYTQMDVLLECVQDSYKRMSRFIDVTAGTDSITRLRECQNNTAFIEREITFQQNLLSSWIERTLGLLENPEVQEARLSGCRFHIQYIYEGWRQVCISLGTTLADGKFERHLDIIVSD